MKLLKAGLVVVSLVGASSAIASSPKFIAGDDTGETKACIAAVTNNLYKYRSIVERFRSGTLNTVRDHQLFANKLNCNDVPVYKFARQYGATRTAQFITRYLDKNILIRQDSEVVETKTLPKTIVITASLSAK